jgi:hypothetical protein
MDTWVDRREASFSATEFARFAERADEPLPDTFPPLLAAVFDQLPYGIMIVTLDGQVLHANMMAVKAINRNNIWIDPERHLVTRRPADAATLRRALAATAGLRRSLVFLGTGYCCLAVAVQPLLPPDSSHLRSIYHKTGSRDLHELMARLAVLPPLGPVMP